jgi:hypothetical protein
VREVAELEERRERVGVARDDARVPFGELGDHAR